MRKIFLLVIIMFLLCGCTRIKDELYDNLIYNSLNSNIPTKNVNRSGYRYYLPKGLIIKDSIPYNDVITSHRYTYYLYVDIVSYNSKVAFTYNENPQSYYSRKIVKGNMTGYIEINKYATNRYLIEIMYNYAKIEVVVYEEDIKESISYAMSILSSITYNDNVIATKLASNEFNTTEEQFNIFEIVGSDNYLEFSQEEENENEQQDPDYIK